MTVVAIWISPRGIEINGPTIAKTDEVVEVFRNLHLIAGRYVDKQISRVVDLRSLRSVDPDATDRFQWVAGETVRNIKARPNDGVDPRLSDGVESRLEDLGYR